MPKTIKIKNEACVMCEINEITVSGQTICSDCQKKFIEPQVCTCDKALNEVPKTLLINESYIKISDYSEFLKLLKKYAVIKDIEYFIIDGCRGCKFSKEQIEKDYTTAERAAITACIYKKINNVGQLVDETNAEKDTLSAMVYCGDSLDDDFISYAKSIGGITSDPLDIVANY